MGKQTQKERAQQYLERHPKLPELYGTSDGFNFEAPQNALTHSTILEDKGIQVFKRNGKTEALETETTKIEQPKFLKQSVVKIAEALPEIKDAEALKGYLAFEQNTENPRSTAIKALEARIEVLTEEA